LPLSETAKKALDDSAKINAENQARKKQQADQQETERKQAENDYNAFIKEQAEIQKQIDILEAQNKAEEQAQLRPGTTHHRSPPPELR